MTDQDTLIERLLGQVATEQARLARSADGRAHELAPWIFLWAPMDLWALSPEVTGWRIPAIFNGQHWTGVRLR